MSILKLFCDGWEFSKRELENDFTDTLNSEYLASFAWERVDIPHDWLIFNTNDLYENSTGWYRKRFVYEKNNDTITSIRFEGVYMNSRVYCNSKLVGEWKYGYSTFEFDLTGYLVSGENELVVMVNHQSPNSRWYSGAGIFRKIYLREAPLSHILPDGVYISTQKDGEDFIVTVSCEAGRPLGTPLSNYFIRSTIYDENGNECSSLKSKATACDISCIEPIVQRENTSYSINHQIIKVKKPALWDIENGRLYTMKTELIIDENVVDVSECRFGFRTIEFTCDNGFFINGRWIKIHGCCEHHDLGALGAAISKPALRRRLLILREMGINSVRTSHNMPSVELMELADEMGFLILSEAFDMWEKPKTDYDYGRFFKEWVAKDVASWVRRDRNHPSIIGWSIGNEIYDTHADDRGQEITSMLARLVRLHDSRSNGYVTIGSNYMQGENARKCADILKLAGYNYGERMYDEHHKNHPDWMIYGSETASVIQSRGIYHFPLSKIVLADDDEQCSSLGNCATAWGAKKTESCIIPDRDAKYCAGQYIWTGFDYIGEPTPYSTKNSYFGQIDTAGFKKDSAYVFQSEWTDYKTAPVVHIFPYWDFNEGQQIDVRVTSNAPRVELFFNGHSMGAFDIDHEKGTQLTADYSIEYTYGVLEAAAYDENGAVIAKDIVRSFGDCAGFELIPNKTEMLADGEDLIYLEISAIDENGTFVANANNRVTVSCKGAGRLIGLDNGDSTDYDQYKGTSRRLFSGKLSAIIASNGKVGDIEVTINSAGLNEQSVTLTAIKADIANGTSFISENSFTKSECICSGEDIPVRKIELRAKNRVLNESCREEIVEVLALPLNTVYADDIEFRITSDIGIQTKTAEVEVIDKNHVKVTAKGDGEFYLRALCKNGTPKYHIISCLPFTATGLGSAVVNPYEFVTAGLNTINSGDTGSGIEQGASFSYENSWFGFENVDFKMSGSDTVTIDVYANMTTPTALWFYDGRPDEGGECIGEFIYHKEPKWLTYIPETYKLNRRLKGVHTLVIMGTHGVNIRGFMFEENAKEFAQIDASDCENIYGDRFEVGKGEVTDIGNNVVLDFGEFDFADKKPSKVVVCGKSMLDITSIHICISQEATTRVLCEFEGSEQYCERSFDMQGIEGKCRVSFTFLPGTDFDFKYFRFE